MGSEGNYNVLSQLRTNKGALQAWKVKIGKAEDTQCRHCGKAVETGDHLVFTCKKWDTLRKEVWIEQEGTGVIGRIWTAAARLLMRRMRMARSLYET